MTTIYMLSPGQHKRIRPCHWLPGAAKLTEGFIEIVFLWLGVGVLLPWNAFISAKPYFQARLCGEIDPVAQNVELWFSIVYNGASVMSLAVLIVVQFILYDNYEADDLGSKLRKSFVQIPPSSASVSAAIDMSHAASEYTWYMVMVPLAVYLGVFIFTTILVFLPSIPPTIFLILTLSGLFICGVCTSVASSGIVGTAGLFEPHVGVNPYFNGQAVGGLLVAVANLSAAIFDGPRSFQVQHCPSQHRSLAAVRGTDEKSNCMAYSQVSWATVGYFASGCVVLAACMLGYCYIDQYKRLFQRTMYSPVPLAEISFEEEPEAAHGHGEHVHFNISDLDRSSDTGRSKWVRRASVSFGSFQNEDVRHSVRSHVTRQESHDSDVSESSLTAAVWNAVQGPAISLFWTYFVTLALFPVWTSELSSIWECRSPSRLRNDLFTPMTFVIFNAGDLVGRVISAEIPIDKVKNFSPKLVLSSIARFCFFPLFLCCAAQSSQFSSIVVKNDIFCWAIQFLFAASNGIQTNLAFCYAPSLVVSNAHSQQVASAILNFSLCFGLLCGSFFSFPFLWFATGHR